MNDDETKKYMVSARTGIRGEAFFESLICNYCLPHHITGHKDLGIDYLCEWVHDYRPTGILFSVQVKTFNETSGKPKFIRTENARNGLDEYEIHNSNLKIDQKTLYYWKGLGMPIYLFAVVAKSVNKEDEVLDCYYKRFTEILTTEKTSDKYEYYDKFYKVNEHNSFIAFKDREKGDFGFARDLFYDYVHWSYHKGSIIYLDPKNIGLNKTMPDGIFVDMIETYKDKVLSTFDQTKRYLEHLDSTKNPNRIYDLLKDPDIQYGTSLVDPSPSELDEQR